MSSLATRVEILKLARALDTTPDELAFLESVPAEHVATLRTELGEVLFRRHEARFRRLAKLSSSVPAGLAAKVAQAALGPLLAARVAAVMDPTTSVKLAGHLSTDFLTDLSIWLDPQRAVDIIQGMPDDLVVRVGTELLSRGEYFTLGQFVSVIDPDVSLRVVGEADGAQLLQVALFGGDSDGLDEIVGRLDDARLAEVIEAAAAEGLYDDAVTLVASVSPTSRARLVPLIAELDQDARDAFVTAVHHHDVWASILPALAELPDDALASIANGKATLASGVMARAVEVARDLGVDGELEPRLTELLDAPHRKIFDKALTSS